MKILKIPKQRIIPYIFAAGIAQSCIANNPSRSSQPPYGQPVEEGRRLGNDRTPHLENIPLQIGTLMGPIRERENLERRWRDIHNRHPRSAP